MKNFFQLDHTLIDMRAGKILKIRRHEILPLRWKYAKALANLLEFNA
jgi:hypothetical protein